MKREIVTVDSKGRVSLPTWVCEGLLKASGSRAKTPSGIRKAVRKQFMKLLAEHVESHKND